MLAKAGSELPIKGDDIAAFTKRATELLTSVTYTPKKNLDALRRGLSAKEGGKKEWSDSRGAESPSASQSVSLIAIAEAANKGDKLLDEKINQSLNAIRDGLKVALHLSSLYAKFSGLDTLRERNSRGALTTDADKAEWAAKQETHAVISVYVLAFYVCWRFESHDDKNGSTNVDFVGIPESIAVGNQMRSFGCTFYHLGSYLKEAQTGAQFQKFAQLFFAAVLAEIKGRARSFKYTDAFDEPTYRLEGTNFKLNGFRGEIFGGQSVVEFKRTEAQQIMGNHEMKRVLTRLAQAVIAYDFERKKNPMMEFEALTWIGVLQGNAGTGKTMGLSYLQTKVATHCEALELPFQLRPIPNAIVQSLQGESAKAYEDWFMSTFDPNYICVAPVDDSEAVYLDRRLQSSSEGSKLVVLAHLRLTEGSTAFNYGNSLQPHASNNVDMIDAPVFSRFMFRVVVPGAQTRNDFMDQLRVWAENLNKKADRGLIDLTWPKDYVYLGDQGFIPKDEADKKADGLITFKDTSLVRLWEDVEKKKLRIQDYDLYGSFFAALHERYEHFTSRDVRNITMNAAARLFGFDFPAEWLTDREAFVARDYDTKKNMILEAALAYQKGLTVEQVLFQEMVHYVESTIAMLDSGRKYRIRQMADELIERREASELAASLETR